MGRYANASNAMSCAVCFYDLDGSVIEPDLLNALVATA